MRGSLRLRGKWEYIFEKIQNGTVTVLQRRNKTAAKQDDGVVRGEIDYMESKKRLSEMFKASANQILHKGPRMCLEGTEYLYDHRQQIWEGTKIGGHAFVSSVAGAAGFLYDTASLKLFDREKTETLRRRIEAQGKRYRELVIQKMENHRLVDSLAVGGDVLADILRTGEVPADVQAAYAAAYPDLAAHTSFAEAVGSHDGHGLTSFISAIKGKLFEMKYVDYLNNGNLPDGYAAQLATSATQPGWDIAITGADGHVANVLQMKATDSAEYVRHALDRYPDIDVVTTDEVYSHLVLNGAADAVTASGINDADLTSHVAHAADSAAYDMDWTPPVISLALIAFTSYNLKDADAYEKARCFGNRAGKSYLSYLLAGLVGLITQTWWLALLAGIGTRYAAHTGKNRREAYQELERISRMNEKIIARLA